ncbi:MAG: hypothetical protein OEP52_08795 [Acidimicrobiia bacterium]|nr:hypothetical protein [Acidimicrobiia bacterium]
MCTPRASCARTIVAARNPSSASCNAAALEVICWDPYATENTKPNTTNIANPVKIVKPRLRSHRGRDEPRSPTLEACDFLLLIRALPPFVVMPERAPIAPPAPFVSV